MDLLNKIRELTHQRGWSIYKLAEKSGISQSTLSNMFARQTMPSVATLLQICEAFNMTLAEFFSEEMNNSEKFIVSKYRELTEENKKIIKELLISMTNNQIKH